MKFINLKVLTTTILFLVVSSMCFSQFNLNKLQKQTNIVSNNLQQTKTTSDSTRPSSTKAISVAAISGKEYYVSPNGGGRLGSKEKPSRDLAVLISQLKAGDVVHIAAGVYTGKAGLSSDQISVPISIIGGYSDDFSTRDPWGEHKTIFSGTNKLKAATTPRLQVKASRVVGETLIDGVIFDNGARNRYRSENQVLILRNANMKKEENPTPSTPALKILVGSESKVTVRNCIIMNTGSTQGALDLQVGKSGEAFVENNLIINNTGEGIMMKTSFHGEDQSPKFYVKNNTILFSWKYDAIASYGGNSIMMDKATEVFATDNVFGFSDMGGVNNIKQCKNLLLKHNLFFGHKKYDYQEFTGGLILDEMVDYAESINPSSSDNFSKATKIPVSQEWAEIYFSRKEISRAAVDDAAKVSNSTNNQVRGILGLPLQGSTVKLDSDVWLHRMKIDDAVKVGTNQYEGIGCKKPTAGKL